MNYKKKEMRLWSTIEESFVKWAIPAIAGGVVFGVITVSELTTANAQQKEFNLKIEREFKDIKHKVESISTIPLIQNEKIRNLESSIDRIDKKIDKLITLIINTN